MPVKKSSYQASASKFAEWCRCLAMLVLLPPTAMLGAKTATTEKLVIGATADFVEKSSGITYAARIDTGATTCSIHAEEVNVVDGDKKMLKNVGKKVSYVLIGPDGQRKKVESTIADTVRVKTSDKDRFERRYKVWMELQHNGISRRVHVTLNDRKHMAYQLLIGRNYLCGKFLVDVAEEHSPLTSDAARGSDQEAPNDAEDKEPTSSEADEPKA